MKVSTALSKLGHRTQDPPISWLMNTALARPKLISLAAGFTDSETLPVAEVKQAFQQVFGTTRGARRALQYGSTMGEESIRTLTGNRLRVMDQAALRTYSSNGKAIQMDASCYAPEGMFITSGSQQLLYLVTEALCDEGDIVLVEDPTYFVYLGIVQSRGLQCRGVPLDEDGINLDRLEQRLAQLRKSGELAKVKLLYLVSYFQNPTGITTAYARKRQALEIVRRYERWAGHPIYVVEDAAYRELRFEGDDVPSLLTAPESRDRVIYGGTFSKPFATGIRVGFGVLPAALLQVALRIKANHDFGTSNLLQQLIHTALQTGSYERHLPDLRRRYARKARIMLRAMEKSLPPEVDWITPHGGLYVWARLPKRIRSGFRSRLFQSALDHDVIYVPGELCYAEDPTRRKPNHELRLSFGNAREKEIKAGIERLGSALSELMT